MDKAKNVVLIKGYGTPHPDRWQNHEKRYAEEQGLHAVYPENLPDFIPELTPTVEGFKAFILDVFENGGLEPDRTVVLAHSIGGSGWLRVLEERAELRACLTTLIGTPRFNRTGVRAVRHFFPTHRFEMTDEERGRVLVVGSDADPIISEQPDLLGEWLRTAHLSIPRAGHFMPKVLQGVQPPNFQYMDLGREWMHVRNRISRINLPY